MSGFLNRLFGKKDPEPVMVIVRLNDRCMPLDRGERYEDPLDAVLTEHGWGSVTGGGTMQSASGEIDFCDIELTLSVSTPAVIDAIVAKLEALGAPRGSEVQATDSIPARPFGKTEGLALYLNGSELPPETYRECDVNFVYSELNRRVEGTGAVHSHWQGPTETALYVYGSSFETMRTAIAPLLGSYPLCERARVVQVA
jgi:hypothetical protein